MFGFFTAYWEHRAGDDEVVYVVELEKIREHYLKTWFTVDFLACIPVEYISRGLKGLEKCSWDVTSSSPCDGEHASLSSGAAAALNFFALLRLLKLLRIARAARISGHTLELRTRRTGVSVGRVTVASETFLTPRRYTGLVRASLGSDDGDRA